jgi:hypothetical protein
VYQIFKATILDVAMQNMTQEEKMEQAGSQNLQKIKSESMLSNGIFRPDSALPKKKCSGSGTGSTQPHEYS